MCPERQTALIGTGRLTSSVHTTHRYRSIFLVSKKEQDLRLAVCTAQEVACCQRPITRGHQVRGAQSWHLTGAIALQGGDTGLTGSTGRRAAQFFRGKHGTDTEDSGLGPFRTGPLPGEVAIVVEVHVAGIQGLLAGGRLHQHRLIRAASDGAGRHQQEGDQRQPADAAPAV